MNQVQKKNSQKVKDALIKNIKKERKNNDFMVKNKEIKKLVFLIIQFLDILLVQLGIKMTV